MQCYAIGWCWWSHRHHRHRAGAVVVVIVVLVVLANVVVVLGWWGSRCRCAGGLPCRHRGVVLIILVVVAPTVMSCWCCRCRHAGGDVADRQLIAILGDWCLPCHHCADSDHGTVNVGGVELRHCDYISTVLYTSNLILFLIHNHPPHHPTIPSMTMTAHGNDDHLATQTR